MDLFKLLMLSGQFWEEGPDMPIAMDYGCAVSISSTSFLIINKRDIREFDAAFESGKPTSNTNWKDSATWPRLQTERWYHPGCAVIGTTLVIAGGFKSSVSTAFSAGSVSSSSYTTIGSIGSTDYDYGATGSYGRRSLYSGARSSSSYGDNFVRSCELLDLETRTIIYGANLEGPNSFLQMITFGEGDTLAAFAHPGPVLKDEMVLWSPVDSKWSRNFPNTTAGSRWPARFGAVAVSKDMICPSDDVELE